ncbi:MAG TPA: efflux RND transporter periplasmic adaptor subunit [Candidatus Polarisedimenticolia bacterium]|nr:efflux RND transporter periplasmic adaptor subunit [Candidatus Polarisedimenticolia bacterium]
MRLDSLKGMRWWAYLVAAMALLIGGYLIMRPASAGADSFLTAPIERGRIVTSITSTGTLQAVLTVQVGSQVTGRIQSLHADFNSLVKKGQVLARIDPATFDAALVRSRADLEDARAGVTTSNAALANEQANLEAGRTALLDTERVYRRTVELSGQGVASARDLEASEAAYHEASSRLEQAKAQVASARAAIQQAEARVKQAQAQVRLAEVNLAYTVIASPVDGVVVSRNVDVGQTVAASLQAPTLFLIANDLTRMQVVANVDEADIGRLTPDAKVAFSVDSFPGEPFLGTIDQIRLNPVVTQNVVTYSVIVNVANPSLKLRPGMTANTTFTIAEADKALKLPNGALRFWPADVPRSREEELLASAREAAEPDVASTDAAPIADAAAASAGDGEVLRFPQVTRVRWRPRVVWTRGDIKDRGAPRPHVVRVGITDGSVSEMKEGDLGEGDLVIVGTTQPVEAQGRPTSPFSSPLSGRPSAKGGGGRRP